MKITDLHGTVSLHNGIKMPYLGLGVFKMQDGTEVSIRLLYTGTKLV